MSPTRWAIVVTHIPQTLSYRGKRDTKDVHKALNDVFDLAAHVSGVNCLKSN